LGLEVLAGGLEEPLVRVDLAVIAMLDAEHKVNSAALQKRIFNAEVPSRALEAMQKIAGNLFLGNAFLHDVTNVLHLKLAVAVHIHESLLEESFLVKESFIAGSLLETFWDSVVSIANHNDEEIVLCEVRFRVNFEAIVVVKQALKSCLQLLQFFVVHRDAHGKLRVLLADPATGPNLGHHRRVFDVTGSTVGAEPSWSKLLVKSRVREHNCFVGNIDSGFPIGLLLHGDVASVHHRILPFNIQII